MKLLVTKSNLAQRNLALEEIILKDQTIKDDVIMFYINKNCIIVGKNQNVWEEINHEFVTKHHINIARRISGGGAVYQDLNNVCFSFITSVAKSYSEFLKPVISFLKTLGLEATFHGKNDIHVNGFKISGNAQFRYQNKMVHHGTILFKTDMSILAKALKSNLLKMESKGIKSHRQRVANLYDLLPTKITTSEFVAQMVAFFKTKYNVTSFDDSNYKQDEIDKLTQIRSEKAWIYGRNPEFDFTSHKRFAGGTIKLMLNTSQNKIKAINFSGDFLSLTNIETILPLFIGVEYNITSIRNVINKLDHFADYFGKIKQEELFSLFFTTSNH